MKVVITLEQRFIRTPDGRIWTQGQFPYSFYLQYLKVFKKVSVIARVLDVERLPSGMIQANGKNVSFIPLPCYIGPLRFLLNFWKIRRIIKKSVNKEDAFILRISSNIASQLESILRKRGYPYGVEFVGDPDLGFSPGTMKHLLRPLFRWIFIRHAKRQSENAVAVSYVTQEYLQRKYPCPNYSIGVSDVQLTKEDFILEPRIYLPFFSSLKIVNVGSFEQLYKGQDVLIDALDLCIKNGLDIYLYLVGDGKNRKLMERKVQDLQLQDRVIFLGQLADVKEVQEVLDQCDLFVLPSRAEALPRSIIEAMARGLPCIGTNIGGIPELISPEFLVPPNDARALALKIEETLYSPLKTSKASEENLEKAKEFTNEVLLEKRIEFYKSIKNSTVLI
jgi:glycosyltransferase involved in cell wall biosynthesis